MEICLWWYRRWVNTCPTITCCVYRVCWLYIQTIRIKQLLLIIVVWTITRFICDNDHHISYHYTSSQAEFSFCHFAFVLFDHLTGLHPYLNFEWRSLFQNMSIIGDKRHINNELLCSYDWFTTKSGNIGSHFEFQDGRQVLNNTRPLT